MSDAGMWTWSIILAILSLVGSYLIAGAWQRWKEKDRA